MLEESKFTCGWLGNLSCPTPPKAISPSVWRLLGYGRGNERLWGGGEAPWGYVRPAPGLLHGLIPVPLLTYARFVATTAAITAQVAMTLLAAARAAQEE